MRDYLLWFIIGGVFIITEIFVPGFVLIWFGIGAIIAGFSALLGASQPFQIAIFFVISIASLVITKVFMKKKEEKETYKVGAERLVGKTAFVTKTIIPGNFGEVKIEGELWIAQANEKIRYDEKVIIEKIDGAHLVVYKIN